MLRLLLAIGVVGLTTLLAWLVGYDGQLRLGIFIAACGLLSYAMLGVADTVALGLERFSLSAWINFLAQAVTLALSAALVLSGAGFLGLLIAATLGVCVTGLYAVRRLARDTPLRAPLEPRAWRSMTGASLPFAAIMLALAVSYKADAVILSMFTGAAQIGAYAVAYNLDLYLRHRLAQHQSGAISSADATACRRATPPRRPPSAPARAICCSSRCPWRPL